MYGWRTQHFKGDNRGMTLKVCVAPRILGPERAELPPGPLVSSRPCSIYLQGARVFGEEKAGWLAELSNATDFHEADCAVPQGSLSRSNRQP